MSKGFKDDILSNLGAGVRCVSSSVSSSRFTTFSIATENL